MSLNRWLAAGVALCALLAANAARSGETFEAVKKRGYLLCGVNNSGLPGFAQVDDKGNWAGLDIDLCRAVAAAVFGDATKVKYVPLSAKERFTALQSKEIDVLSRNSTWTLARDSALGLDFVAVNYYDGQGFMVPKSLGVKSAKELDGASVCVQTGTTTELNLADFFRANNMKYEPVVFETNDELITAFQAGRCDVFTTDQSGLYSSRTKFEKPENWVVLPDVISKEPLGPAVRHGDNEWADVVRWSFYAMVEAEELGVTSKNVEEMKKSTNPNIRRLLGVEGELGKGLGLPNDFAAKIIAQVGNYGESFERNLGMNTPLKIERGLNALWSKGGLMYAPPFR
ncbi:MAG: amino acid ABC transporter substrate-binding protein [Geminicoccaceae bacterium]|nr:amino acid ABC transporter substrate-binding protein [Geminicoccaceae bacterium]MCS7268972.1 amino acid ABC transporter substrate-binding protein [Geminicoccaceae bacterium]MCX7629885.1 amino acid ABC transporter substrate-binding protein [Geminicoccaceae bacterium]MDW8124073.1 amino acid ABC transporter substrate-binding protein [Geminicoccaceae bacterium]MDW8340264.1 amino acid ABC transporter substrate-binding protein [Geminicoccaceae bacterium]